MSHHRHRTSDLAIFLGAVLLCLASIAGKASAQRNTRTIPAPLEAGRARPAASSASAVPNRPAQPPGKGGLNRGRRQGGVDRAQRTAPAAINAKARAIAPAPLPKIVEKKSVSDDPLAGIKL